MQKKKRKKQIILWILLILLFLAVAFVVVPIATLYVQYHNISYAPSTLVERSDTYVIPDYPDLTPGSEGITDLFDDPDVSEEGTGEIPVEIDTVEETPEISDTEPITTDAETEPEISDTEPISTETEAETTAFVEETTNAPETLPAVIEPPATTPPQTNSNHSFANSTKVISVYGKTPIYKVEKKNDDIMNILVLGTDSRDVERDRGRSDTMIVVSYNKKTGEIKMVSLLRDMLVPIEGYDWNRINTAYYFDGVGLAINTVNQLFGLDIQHFVVVDFNGAKDFIDYIGGIELTLSKSEANIIGVPYSSEPIHLDGHAALAHMQNRTSDNDFGRTERQRDVIVAVFNKIIRKNSLTEILNITQYAMGLVKTNIPASTLTSLATSIVGNAGNISIKSQSLPYRDAFKYAWYKNKAILSFDIASTSKRVLEFLYG